MCDYFWQRMDSSADQGGDLADIVRSVAGAAPSTSSSDVTDTNGWQFPADPAAPSFQQQLSTDDFAAAGDGFGLRDPLLNELAGAAFFDCGGGGEGSEKYGGGGGGSSAAAAPHHQKLLIGDGMKRPCGNLFSRVLQISPAKPSPLSPRAIKPLPMVDGDIVKLDHGVQISSPRTPGIKRRKSQAKKVVCIPAPAPAATSNRASGEVVPSDLWAWRKYGQKPIKGSPYPRGYYRCSSSKGCSARKQVERSRTDPNMLVITYTSEHNHPWPTQRNALAGSTRSQPSKNSSASSASKSSSLHHNNNRRQPTPNLKEEPRENTTTTTTSSSGLPMVKEEVVGEMENVDAIPMVNDNAFDDVFYNEPVMAENQPDDFFADLAELEPDPMSLIFSRPGFIGEKPEEEEEKESNKGMDPFINMFDWGGSTFGDHQSKKGL